MEDTGKPDRERDKILHVKLTQDEKTELRVKAARRDMSMSEYVRDVLFSEANAVPA